MRRFLHTNRYLFPDGDGDGGGGGEGDAQPNIKDGGDAPKEPTDAEVFEGLTEAELATLSDEDRAYVRAQHTARKEVTSVQYAQMVRLAEYGQTAVKRDIAAREDEAKNNPDPKPDPKPEPPKGETGEQKRIRVLEERLAEMETGAKKNEQINRGKEFADAYAAVATSHDLTSGNADAQKLLKRLAVGIVATEGFNGRDDQTAVRMVMDEIKKALVDPAGKKAIEAYLKDKLGAQLLGETRGSPPPGRSSSDKVLGAKEWKDGTVLRETMKDFVAGASG